MPSLTAKTERVRARKKSNQGADRKRRLRKNGSTPKFAIHPEPQAKADKG